MNQKTYLHKFPQPFYTSKGLCSTYQPETLQIFEATKGYCKEDSLINTRV